MRRPSYEEAIRWLVNNDDNEWVERDGQDHGLSVTAALVSDIFSAGDDRVFKDLKAALKKEPKG